jgi:hypothetical protein
MSDNKTMADYKKSILWLAASNYFEGVGIWKPNTYLKWLNS